MIPYQFIYNHFNTNGTYKTIIIVAETKDEFKKNELVDLC